jgi:hypothetical protein
VQLLTGEPNDIAVTFLRVMAFLPTLAALNSLNVLQLLIKNDNRAIFRIAVIVLLLAFGAAGLLVFSSQYRLFGTYTLIVEVGALLLYEYRITRQLPTSE